MDGLEVSAILGAGIYLLLRRTEVVYVGQAQRLLPRLYAHRNLAERRRRGGPKNVKVIQFDQVRVVPCTIGLLDRLEQELIRKYRPKHNVHHNGDKKTLAEVGFDLSAMIPPVAPIALRRRA